VDSDHGSFVDTRDTLDSNVAKNEFERTAES
jgi:hypothetical protein